MSHGEQWIVPLNLIIIIAFAVVWGVTFPLWTTLLIALPLALVLAFFGIDKYGGMQIVMIVAPACLMATVGIAKKYRAALETHSELNIGYLALQFAGTIAYGAAVLFAILAAFVGVAIGWDWFSTKVGVQRRKKADEQTHALEPAAGPDSNKKSSPPAQ